MAEGNSKLISFSDEVFKRTGVRLDLAKIAARNKANAERIRVDPESDIVIRLAMDVLSPITPYVDAHPIAVVAALQVVANMLSAEYERKLGREKAVKLVLSAEVISKQYKPEFKDEQHGPVATDQEDDPKR